jgi:serine/threonine protein kinase
MSGIPAGAGSLIGKRLGKYEILALLALGGTAEIYLARIGGAAGFEKYVVVKCLHDHLADDAEFVKMFLDEARLAAHLDHSNIVQTMELGEHEHRYYMVMEFLAGMSLAMMVRRAAERVPGGRIPVPLVLNIIAQACAGLHYAHERVVNGKPLNIVHRDISPQNLVVSFEGVVKLVDFGIAKAELRETRTQSGTIKGKFAYMSPEQCVATNVDRRTDVFALGVIAHELLTGRRLFKKPSPYETYQAVIECAVEPPSRIDPSLDPALDPIIMRALAKDKDRRYATAEELGDALLGYLHQRGISSGPGDVSRFFEASFGQEIDEHGARMRELISGRAAAEPAATWAAGDDDKPADAGDGGRPGSDRARTAGSADPGGSLSGVIGNLESASGGDDDMPAERTRIESNPLERLNELDAEHARTKQAEAAKKTPPQGQAAARTPPPVLTRTPSQGQPQPATQPLTRTPPQGQPQTQPLTRTPPQGQMQMQPPQQPATRTPPQGQPHTLARTPPQGQPPPSGPLPLSIPSGPLSGSHPVQSARTGATPAPVRIGASGKFPEAANLPTMIAQPDGTGDDDDDDPVAPELAKTELGAPVYPNEPAPPTRQPDPNARTVLDMAAPNLDQIRASMGLPPQEQPPQAPPPQGQPPQAQSQPPQPHPDGIGAQLGPANGPGPMPSQQLQMPPPMTSRPVNLPPLGPGGYPRMDTQMRDQMASGATVFPSGGGGGQHDSHRPMDMGAPTGHSHPMSGEWPGGHAGMLGRAMPPWLLAVLFVGALGGALLITILIAHAVR